MEQPQSLAVFGTKPNEEGTSVDPRSEGMCALGGRERNQAAFAQQRHKFEIMGVDI